MNFLKVEKKVSRIVKRAAGIFAKGTGTVTQKAGAANIVTDADVQVQRYLQEKLGKLIPDSGFLCEEENVVDTKKEYLWVIDPIDGTTNFVRGLPECVISVALLYQNEPVVGVVYAPRLKLLFTAVKGKGAFCCGKRIYTSQKTFPESLLCTGLCVYQKELSDPCSRIISRAHPQCSDIRRLGSCALELCCLALGRCDLYFEIRTYPWDYAAGLLMIQEAGGVLRGYRGEKLNFDGMTMLVGANNQENFDKLNEIVGSEIPERPVYKEHGEMETKDTEKAAVQKEKEVEDGKFKHKKWYVKEPGTYPKHVDVNALYQQVCEELTLQQSKRDQLLMIYMAAFAFIVPALLSEKGINLTLSGCIFVGLGVIGYLFSLIVIRYRKYKESYWICCRTLSVMMTLKPEEWTKENIQAIYYMCMEKKVNKYINGNENAKHFDKWKYTKANINSGETLYLVILAVIAGSVFGMGFGMLLPLVMWLKILIGAVSGTALCLAAIYKYFATLIGVYKVCEDGLEKSFNKPFEDAWFLHFFVDKNK